MEWQKLGRVVDWHAAYPVVDRLADAFRIYYSARTDGVSRIFTFDVALDNPLRIIRPAGPPLIEPGPPGTFDCDGVAPRCLVTVNGQKRLYTIGWNKKITTPYQLAVGVAVEEDGRWTRRPGPVLDRSFDDPIFCTSACVIHTDRWQCWYCSCTDWVRGQDPVYLIKYAESDDGFHWNKLNQICLGYDEFTKAIGWPMVWIENGSYRMIYSHRSDHPDYRTDSRYSYRLGYAESADGISWTRKDSELGLERSPVGWDAEMMAYASLADDYLFYNGNGFGKTGIGVAKRVR